jgi:hypothetical protein
MTLVEFADFDCPHCAAVQATVDRLLDQNKDLRLCALEFLIHPTDAGRGGRALRAGTGQVLGDERRATRRSIGTRRADETPVDKLV